MSDIPDIFNVIQHFVMHFKNINVSLCPYIESLLNHYAMARGHIYFNSYNLARKYTIESRLIYVYMCNVNTFISVLLCSKIVYIVSHRGTNASNTGQAPARVTCTVELKSRVSASSSLPSSPDGNSYSAW